MKVNTNNLFMPQLDAYVALPRCLIYFFWALVHVTFQLLVYPFKILPCVNRKNASYCGRGVFR
jgi:hypothetical protein